MEKHETVDRKIYRDWFEEIFELIVPCNIVLCGNMLFSLCFVDIRKTRPKHYRISSGPCVEEYTITENQFEEVFTRLIKVCRTTFNSPEKIATACSTEHYECIKGLIYITCRVLNDIVSSDTIFCFDCKLSRKRINSWKWIAQILLEGLRNNEYREIHSKIYAITSSLIFGKLMYGFVIDDPTPIPIDLLDETSELFDHLFDGCQNELMQELSKGSEPYNTWSQEHINRVKQTAQDWLKKHSS